MLRLLMIWTGWRLIRRLLSAALLAGSIALAASALSSPGALERRGAGIARQLDQAARPLINDAQHAVEHALTPPGRPRRR